MQLRKVDIDFSDAVVHWNPEEPEYSQLLNAISTMIPYLEPYLIKAVRAAKPLLPEEAVALRRDADLFVSQEGRHFKMHMKFNQMLRESGYAWVAESEAKIKGDFERFAAKGDKFALAYSEGFETFGPIVSEFFFEKATVLMDDWDEPTVYLWLWHFAEEYEHRTACNYIYREIYDDYWYRIYGLWFATFHLFGHSFKVAHKLIAADRKAGLIAGRSRVRFARVLLRLAAHVLPRMIFRCMRPRYDPARIPPPKQSMEFLAAASQRYGILEPA